MNSSFYIKETKTLVVSILAFSNGKNNREVNEKEDFLDKNTLSDLSLGDFIVHKSFGVGLFRGVVFRDEINKKLDDKKRKQLKTRNHANPNTIQFILRQSTDERGILTLSSLHHILQCEGISDPSPEQIIGMAELQGVVQRVGDEEWKWLA